jgi:hypothetical protein
MYSYVRRLRACRRRRDRLSADMRELRVSRLDPEAVDNIPQTLALYGVVVVTDVIPPGECDVHVRNIVNAITSISDGVDASDPHDFSTWREDCLPPQTQPGVFACMGVGNTTAVWDVRLRPEVKQVFAAVYGTEALVTSNEMIHVKPPMPPFHDPTNRKDWAHTDNLGATDRCVQGQVVLTDTTASLVASPGSHRIASALTHFRRTHDINGDMGARAEAQRMVEEAGGRFQVPILAPKGSMIVFLSATLHSAKFVDRQGEVCDAGHSLAPIALMDFTAVMPVTAPAPCTVSLLNRYEECDPSCTDVEVVAGMVDAFAMLGVHDRAAKLGHEEVLRRIQRYTHRFRCHVCHPREFGQSFGSLAAALALGTDCVAEARAVAEAATRVVAAQIPLTPPDTPHTSATPPSPEESAFRATLEQLANVLETVRLVEDGRHPWLRGAVSRSPIPVPVPVPVLGGGGGGGGAGDTNFLGPDVSSSSPWVGWRCVVYVAFRPLDGLPQTHLDKLRLAFDKSVVTRHGGDDIFPIKDIRVFPCAEFSPKITAAYMEWARTGLFPDPAYRQPLTDPVKILLGMHVDPPRDS